MTEPTRSALLPPAAPRGGVAGSRPIVAVVVLGLLGLRVILAMLLPALREPGWPDSVVLVAAVVGAGYLVVTGPVAPTRWMGAGVAAAFWLAPCVSAAVHNQAVPVASAAMAAVAVTLIVAPPDSSGALRLAIGAGALICLLSLVYGLLSLAGIADGAFHAIGDYQRAVLGVPALGGITLHPNTLGAVAAATLVISLAVASANRRAGAFVIPLIALVALLWSQSRSGVLGALLAVFTLFVVRRWEPLRPYAVGGALVLAVIPPGATWLMGGTVNLYALFTGREIAWDAAVRLFRDSPVTGYGPDALSTEFWSTQPEQWWEPLHAHNQILEVAAQDGLVGLTALLALVIVGVVVVLSRFSWNGALVAALTVMVGAQAGLEVPLGLTYFPISYLVPAMVVSAFAFGGSLTWNRRRRTPARG